MPAVQPPVDHFSDAHSSSNQPRSSRSPAGKVKRGKTVATEAADELITARIAEASKALWWGELVRCGLKLVLGVVAGIGVWILLDHWVLSRPSLTSINTWARVLALLGLVVAASAYIFFKIVPLIGHSISPEYAARSLERNYPNLRQALTSYVTLKDDPRPAGLPSRVVQSIGTSTAGYLKQHDELPEEATGNMKLWVSTAAALAMLVFYAAVSPKNSLQSVSRLLAPTASIAPVTRVSIVDVTPGDAEAIAGRRVEVTAEIRGMRTDDKALCEIQYASGAKRIAMHRSESLGANRYVADITLDHAAQGEVPYRVLAGDGASSTYHLRVKDVPVVALRAVKYSPPAYTGTLPFTRTTGAISAIDGTTITLTATTNRAITRAAIEFNPKPVGDTIQATDGAVEMNVGEDGRSLTVSFALLIDGRRSASVRRDSYRVRVWDEVGASNPEPIIYPIDIIADLPPEVAIMLPTRVPKDVPIGTQQIIEVHAMDADFGLSEIRLQMKSGIRNVGNPVLWRDSSGEPGNGKRGNTVGEYRFRPRELDLSVGDVVRIIAVATDNKTSQANNKVEGNVSETDPIELRIVAADQMPPPEDAASEGLSETDDKPASDPESSEEGADGGAGDGEQQQGGGGSEGEQGSQQSGESGQQGSGGGQGDQSEQSEGENQGEGGQSGGGGEKGSESQGDSSGQGGEGQPDGEPSDSESGESEPSEGEAGEGKAGEGAAGGGEASEGQQMDGEPSSGEPSEKENGQGEPNQGGTSQGNPPQDGSSGGQDSPSESGDQSAPQHDGEAFERIQEYLNEKQQQQGGQANESSESGEPSEGEASQNQADQNQDSKGQQGESTADQQSGQRSDQQSDQQSGQGSESGSQGEPSDSSKGSQDRTSKNGSDASDSAKGEQAGQTDSEQDGQNSDAGNTSDQGADPKSASKQGEGEQGDGEQNEGDGEGEQGTSEQGAGEQGDASEQGADSNTGKSGQSPPDKNAGEPSEGQPGSESQTGNSDQAGTPSQDDAATQARSPKPSSQGRPGSGDGSGEGVESESAQTDSETEAANDDYARKATDMVLDYLDQTRDAPDQELLDRLNWTQQDLQKFQDRWKDIGEVEGDLNSNDSSANRATEEALRSLGLRPPSTGQNRSTQEQADSMRGIRDSGNRRRPPAALRDAFDAFRRQMGE